ncbi:DUF1707 SHOCT-like domain-containing protein [Streptomyces sp. NRRL F-5126]|uniref:DUF1707 SHOCT-like domain-containing protein n=1 Tax=Streptomyces sp. NRRL F-5126 TaxID=1463857 RepID=UPI0004C73E83|nr:DUF1707 domain-containing protein [Streptomyces sp. NRRL F-5126]
MTSELPDRRASEAHSPDTRASDAEREQVAERLREAMAEGRLDMEEFDERLGLAYRARTQGDLVPLVRDLPLPAAAKAAGVAASTAHGVDGAWADRVGRGPATSTGAFGFMGGFGRKGNWTVGRRFLAVVFMGGGEIDLREARFEEPVTIIRCFAMMGGVQVTAPPDLDIEVRGFGFMGGFGEVPGKDDVAGADPDPGSPKVIVTGFALMGGVGVERKLRKEERRRLKEERRRERLEAGREAYEDSMARHEDVRARERARRDERRALAERHREERRAAHRERHGRGRGRLDKDL